MRTKRITIGWTLVLVLSAVTIIRAQTTSVIKGLVFADYYYHVNHHDRAKKDENAFTFRRIYFTFENNLTENIKIRFRLESASNKFGEAEKINPFVKHAYLEWSNLIPNHKLYLGIAETNGFKNTEAYWGYRSVEKTIMGLNKISSSADFGLAIKGDLGGIVHHWLTIFNGTGYESAEVDRFKKIGYAFWLTPVRGLMLEGYIDYEKQDPNTGTFTGAKDYYHSSGYTTIKGFVGYTAARFTLGVEGFSRKNKGSGSIDAVGTSKTDVVKRGISIFGSWITPIPKLKVFARYDVYDPNIEDGVWVSDTMNGTDDDFSLIIAGLDYIPMANLHIMPNVWIKQYSASGQENDFVARITVYYQFSSGKIVI